MTRQPTAIDVDEIPVSPKQCQCDMKEFHADDPSWFPICDRFTNTHPIEKYSGVACGTKLGIAQYCGHPRECHLPKLG